MEWIPINKDWPDKEELPDSYVDVLISIEDVVCIAYRTGDYWFLDGVGTFNINDADAWMPKPKPYRG